MKEGKAMALAHALELVNEVSDQSGIINYESNHYETKEEELKFQFTFFLNFQFPSIKIVIFHGWIYIFLLFTFYNWVSNAFPSVLGINIG